jgi:hypothetical protein
MKRIYFSLLALLAVSAWNVASAAFPETGKKYYIKNVDAGLYLSASREAGDYPVIDYPIMNDPNFQFEFFDVGNDYYQAATRSNTLYLYADGGWNCIFSTAHSDDANALKLVAADGGYKISFKPKEPAVLGLNGLTAGERVWTDKGDGAHPVWEITEVPAAFELGITAKIPAEEADKVSQKNPVTIAFNLLITLANNTSVGIKDSKGQDVGGVTVSVEGNVLTINHNEFSPLTQYTVTVPAGTVVGYDQAIVWSFTTLESAKLPASSADTGDGAIWYIINWDCG